MPEGNTPTGGDGQGVAANWVVADRYRVLDRLGSGAMADVFRAHDETLDRDVALKVFRTVMDDADTAGAARRELELQCLAQLNHPNLVTLFDGSVSDDGPSFLALELVDGPTLAAVLRDGPLPEPLARDIGAQIADALAFVHQRGMVHRDVKPANILLGTDNRVPLADTAPDADPGPAPDPATVPVDGVRARLSDFGIVRLVDSAQVTAADLTVGTAYYLAPEQARSAAVEPAADVYSLGLVLLEALTGARAFEGPMHEVLLARLMRDPQIPDSLPAPWPALLTAMTASDPAQRPSAADVARTLRGASSASMPAALVAAPDPFPPVAEAPTAAVAAPVLAGAALGAAAGAVATSGSGELPVTDGTDGTDVAGSEAGGSHLVGMAVAAAAFLLIIAGAGWFFLHPTAHATSDSVGTPGAGAQHSSGSSGQAGPGASRHAGATVPVDQPVTVTSGVVSLPGGHAAPEPGAAKPAGPAHHPGAPGPSHSTAPKPASSSPAAPSPTAPSPTSSQPTTSTPPPPSSSAPTTTSSAPSTTSAPPTTVTSAAASSAAASSSAA